MFEKNEKKWRNERHDVHEYKRESLFEFLINIDLLCETYTKFEFHFRIF